MKQEFLKGKTDTIRLSVYENNRPLIPDSVKITLYKPSGSELQAQASGSVDGTTGEMSYNLTATHTADHDTNYKAVWEYVYNGSTYYQTQLFDVVKSKLSIPITDDDLFDELSSLKDQYEQKQGTADSGSTSTLVDAERKEADNYWKGGKIEILAGTGEGDVRDITGFTKSTSTFSVTPNFSATPDTTSIYRVIRSFTSKIEQGFEEICTMLYNKGNRASLILESSQIKFPLLYLTISKIALDLSDEVDDKWDRLANSYYTKFENSFTNMKLEYDADESGYIEGEEEGMKPNTLRLFRS